MVWFGEDSDAESGSPMMTGEDGETLT